MKSENGKKSFTTMPFFYFNLLKISSFILFTVSIASSLFAKLLYAPKVLETFQTATAFISSSINVVLSSLFPVISLLILVFF